MNPAYDFMDSHTKEEKKTRIETRYKRAGFKKINFATNGLICFILSTTLAIGMGIFSKNVFMGIVFFGIG